MKVTIGQFVSQNAPPEGKKELTLDQIEQKENETLGVAISQWAGWNGVRVMRVFLEALSDSNYHREAEQVADMIKKAEEDD